MKGKILCTITGIFFGLILGHNLRQPETTTTDPKCQWATATIDFLNSRAEARSNSTGKPSTSGERTSDQPSQKTP